MACENELAAFQASEELLEAAEAALIAAQANLQAKQVLYNAALAYRNQCSAAYAACIQGQGGGGGQGLLARCPPVEVNSAVPKPKGKSKGAAR